MSGNTTRLFVYGSLKRDGRHHDYMARAEFRTETETESGYHLVRLGEYLALAEGGSERVSGELYLVSQAQLRELDAFEGDEYERRFVTLLGGVTAQAYFARSAATRGSGGAT